MKKEMYASIAEQCGSPFYLFDIDMLTEHVREIKTILGNRISLCYAMKANAFLVEPLKKSVDCFEVCSPGEYAICERAHINMEKIVLSGVYKEKTDVYTAMRNGNGKGIYTVESYRHLEIINECAVELKKTVCVLLRVTSGNQFGLDETDVKEIIKNRKKYPNLSIRGIQCYTGTQKKKIKKIKKELEWLDILCKELKEEYGFITEEIEYGPGLPVLYFQGDNPEEYELLTELRTVLDSMEYQGKVTLEMGRYIAAECGYYFTKVVDKKKNQGENYCIVDGGIHHINYYGQTFAMKTPFLTHLEENDEEKSLWKICGALCTVGDVIVKNYPLSNLKIGDFLVFENIGAYSVTEGMYLFLSRNLPAIYFYSKEKGVELKRAEFSTHTLNF